MALVFASRWVASPDIFPTAPLEAQRGSLNDPLAKKVNYHNVGANASKMELIRMSLPAAQRLENCHEATFLLILSTSSS